MKQFKVAIVSDDAAYAEALMRGIRYRSRAFLVSLHSRVAFTERWKRGGLSYRKSYDIILWDGADGEKIRGENIVWITDRIEARDHMDRPGDKSNIIYRYETASAFGERVMDIAGCGGSVAFGRKGNEGLDPDVRVFAFGSWQGGAGCTTVCRAVGQELTRFFGKRVLWLTLDGIEPGPVGDRRAGEADRRAGGVDRRAGGVDRFLYSLFGSGDQGPDIEKFLTSDGYGLLRLEPSVGRNPLPGLSAGEAAEFMKAVTTSGAFDAVLIDGGTCCSDGAAEMMGTAERICLVGETDRNDRERRYRSWLEHSLGDGSRSISAGALGKMEGDDEILLEGEFGKNIHALAETLWYNEIEHITQ